MPTGETDRQTYAQPRRSSASLAIDRPGAIVLVGHHLSASTRVRCLIRKISVHGALLDVSPHVEIPANFFLEILGINDEIGCTLVERNGEALKLRFNMLLAPEFLQTLVQRELTPSN